VRGYPLLGQPARHGQPVQLVLELEFLGQPGVHRGADDGRPRIRHVVGHRLPGQLADYRPVADVADLGGAEVGLHVPGLAVRLAVDDLQQLVRVQRRPGGVAVRERRRGAHERGRVHELGRADARAVSHGFPPDYPAGRRMPGARVLVRVT
jgi:hypothetical protein